MKIRIAVAGDPHDDKQIFGKIDLLIGQIKSRMAKENTDIAIEILLSPVFAGESWLKWNEFHDFEICAFCEKKPENAESVTRVRLITTPIRSMIGDDICDTADILLGVWSEDAAEKQGAVWELFQLAHIKKMPCVWISSKTKETYCLNGAYYGKYSPSYLEDSLLPLPAENLEPLPAPEDTKKAAVFWKRVRSRFLKKYKANTHVFSAEEDILLTEQFSMEPSAKEGEPLRKKLLEKYTAFDASAIRQNEDYHTRLYQRSILPMITMFFVAIASYSDSFIGTAYKLLFGRVVSEAVVNRVGTAATILASFGFLIYAILNYYVYRLSTSERIHRQHRGFTENRFTAELLRVLIHLTPYGLRPDLRKLCHGREKLFMQIAHIDDAVEPAEMRTDPENIRCAMVHLREMLTDQINYHGKNAVQYGAIVKSLEKWGKRILYIGIATVIARELMEFTVLIINSVDKNILVDIKDLIKAFLSFAALFFPAWATYFTTKLELNNYRFNFNNHTAMEEKLKNLCEQIDIVLASDEIPLELSLSLADQTAAILVNEDAERWTYRYMNSKIEKLS